MSFMGRALFLLLWVACHSFATCDPANLRSTTIRSVQVNGDRIKVLYAVGNEVGKTDPVFIHVFASRDRFAPIEIIAKSINPQQGEMKSFVNSGNGAQETQELMLSVSGYYNVFVSGGCSEELEESSHKWSIWQSNGIPLLANVNGDMEKIRSHLFLLRDFSGEEARLKGVLHQIRVPKTAEYAGRTIEVLNQMDAVLFSSHDAVRCGSDACFTSFLNTDKMLIERADALYYYFWEPFPSGSTVVGVERKVRVASGVSYGRPVLYTSYSAPGFDLSAQIWALILSSATDLTVVQKTRLLPLSAMSILQSSVSVDGGDDVAAHTIHNKLLIPSGSVSEKLQALIRQMQSRNQQPLVTAFITELEAVLDGVAVLRDGYSRLPLRIESNFEFLGQNWDMVDRSPIVTLTWSSNVELYYRNLNGSFSQFEDGQLGSDGASYGVGFKGAKVRIKRLLNLAENGIWARATNEVGGVGAVNINSDDGEKYFVTVSWDDRPGTPRKGLVGRIDRRRLIDQVFKTTQDDPSRWDANGQFMKKLMKFFAPTEHGAYLVRGEKATFGVDGSVVDMNRFLFQSGKCIGDPNSCLMVSISNYRAIEGEVDVHMVSGINPDIDVEMQLSFRDLYGEASGQSLGKEQLVISIPVRSVEGLDVVFAGSEIRERDKVSETYEALAAAFAQHLISEGRRVYFFSTLKHARNAVNPLIKLPRGFAGVKRLVQVSADELYLGMGMSEYEIVKNLEKFTRNDRQEKINGIYWFGHGIIGGPAYGALPSGYHWGDGTAGLTALGFGEDGQVPEIQCNGGCFTPNATFSLYSCMGGKDGIEKDADGVETIHESMAKRIAERWGIDAVGSDDYVTPWYTSGIDAAETKDGVHILVTPGMGVVAPVVEWSVEDGVTYHSTAVGEPDDWKYPIYFLFHPVITPAGWVSERHSTLLPEFLRPNIR